MSHSDVFVIGAGPAGLTASYLLTKQGISTTVIEADPAYVGGISRTANYKNFLFEIQGSRRSLEGNSASGFHHAAAHEPHLLRRKILLLPAQGLRGTWQPRRRRKRHVCLVVYVQAGFSERKARDLSRLGVEPVRRTAV